MCQITQRFKDWWLERRICRLESHLLSAMRSGNSEQAHRLWLQISQCQASRSPDQIKRMEQSMGVHRG